MPTAPNPSATPDPGVEAQVFWIKYHKEITAFLVMAIAAAIGFAIYQFYSQRQNSAAALLLASAKKAPDFQQIITQYPNTPAAASAYLFKAQTQRSEKNFAESNATLQEFISKHPKHELGSSARLAKAANFESLGKTDDALSMYQEAAASDPRGFNAPLALISQVHLLKAKNKNDAARQVCENIVMQYPRSFWMNEAMRELGGLKPFASAARSTSTPTEVAPPAMLARPPSAPAPAANSTKPN